MFLQILREHFAVVDDGEYFNREDIIESCRQVDELVADVEQAAEELGSISVMDGYIGPVASEFIDYISLGEAAEEAEQAVILHAHDYFEAAITAWNEENREKYVIVKASRLYVGGKGYEGPTCKAADVEPGLIYTDRSEAERDRAKLDEHNPVGFRIETYRQYDASYDRTERVMIGNFET